MIIDDDKIYYDLYPVGGKPKEIILDDKENPEVLTQEEIEQLIAATEGDENITPSEEGKEGTEIKLASNKHPRKPLTRKEIEQLVASYEKEIAASKAAGRKE